MAEGALVADNENEEIGGGYPTRRLDWGQVLQCRVLFPQFLRRWAWSETAKQR